MSTTEKRQGSCHCGKVTFTAEVDLSTLIACNCSMCGRSGTILTFIPEEQFTLESGEQDLKDYQFGKKHIHHTFCSTCGVKPFGSGIDPTTGGTTYAVNVRCLDDIDTNELEPQKYDGKNL